MIKRDVLSTVTIDYLSDLELLDVLNKDKKLLKQTANSYYEMLLFQKTNSPQFDSIPDEVLDYIKNISNEEVNIDLVHNLKNIENLLKFFNYKERTTLFFQLLDKIVEQKGKISLKNCMLNKLNNISKDEAQRIITSILLTNYQLTLYYKYIIISQFTKDSNFYYKLKHDEDFKLVCKAIQNFNSVRDRDTGKILKLAELEESDVISIIRNGIAHMSYSDDINVDCENFEELVDSMFIRLNSKDNSKCTFVNNKLIKLLYRCIDKIISKEYILSFNNSEKNIEKIIAEGSLKDFELDFINDMRENTDVSNYSIFLNVKNPSFLLFDNINEINQYIFKLNKNRNKTSNNADKALSTFIRIAPIYLFQDLSFLNNFGLTKEFAEYIKENSLYNKFPSFNINETTKRKSIINKFRLLRHSLAHGNILPRTTFTYSMYDVDDETKEKIFLGDVSVADMYQLCELIENFTVTKLVERVSNINNLENKVQLD